MLAQFLKMCVVVEAVQGQRSNEMGLVTDISFRTSGAAQSPYFSTYFHVQITIVTSYVHLKHRIGDLAA